jgi:hypothetical protein
MLIINDEQDIKRVINIIVSDQEDYIIDIKSTYLKNIFFYSLKKYIPELGIINCNSSERRLLQDIDNSRIYDLIILDGIKNFNNLRNINILNRKIYIY